MFFQEAISWKFVLWYLGIRNTVCSVNNMYWFRLDHNQTAHHTSFSCSWTINQHLYSVLKCLVVCINGRMVFFQIICPKDSCQLSIPQFLLRLITGFPEVPGPSVKRDSDGNWQSSGPAAELVQAELSWISLLIVCVSVEICACGNSKLALNLSSIKSGK